jgi:hypothetical protein
MTDRKWRGADCSNSNAVTLILDQRWSLRNVAGQFDVKRFYDDAYVLGGIFFFKVFPNLRRHIAFPKVQNLPLVTRECL